MPLTLTSLANSQKFAPGIGSVITGYEKCGVCAKSCNENNKVFTEWLKKKGKQVIEGDISDPQVIAQLSQVCGGILAGGISCQPWSSLGDQKAFADDHSRSMPGAFLAIHLLQVPLALLECTPAVLQSPDAQQMLRTFAVQTGRVIQQSTLSLHTFWPAKRQRWWATISHPCLNIQPIPEIPHLAFQPSLLHLMPKFMQLEGEDLDALRLDDEEMEQFLTTRRGMVEHQVDNFKPLPTATHSWGSQLRGCLCGCRQRGFSRQRIESKGLYAQLLPLEEHFMMNTESVRRMRHLHASEVALANGLDPFFPGFADMPPRLALAGVGQMASPFQGAWVLACALNDMKKAGFPLEVEQPLSILQPMASSLFHARDKLLGFPVKTELMLRFEQAIQLWDSPEANEVLQHFVMPTHHLPSHEPVTAKDSGTSDSHLVRPTTSETEVPVRPSDHKAVDVQNCTGPLHPCRSASGMPPVPPSRTAVEVPIDPCNAKCTGCPSCQLHPLHRSPSVPTHPTPCATPLPRLGCGGPSRMNAHEIMQHKMDHSGDDQQIHVDLSSTQAKKLPDTVNEAPKTTSCADHLQVPQCFSDGAPPTPARATPLSRPGCGGPPKMMMR